MLPPRTVSLVLLLFSLLPRFEASTPAQAPRIESLKVRKAQTIINPRSQAPQLLRPGSKKRAPLGLPCLNAPPPVQWIPKPFFDPPTWQKFAGDLESWREFVETLDLGSDVVAQATALRDEATGLGAKDAQLATEKETLHSTQEDLVSIAGTLFPEICSFNREVASFNSSCAGELPKPEFERCTAWKGQLEARLAVLQPQRTAYEDRRIASEATSTRLITEEQALATRVQALNDKVKAFPDVMTAAARRRKPTRGYEIDASSFIQLADKEDGWLKVQELLLENKGSVFISERAETEVYDVPQPGRVLARKALMAQWNIRPAEKDVSVALVEFFANVGVHGKDAEIAASAWKHFRTLITKNPSDFAPAAFPNFPYLMIVSTKGWFAPIQKRQTRRRVSYFRLVWETPLRPGEWQSETESCNGC